MCVMPERRADVARWWTELWSEHDGTARVYCGVARTDEGFAVDLFRGDTCILSEAYGTRKEAVAASLALRPGLRRQDHGLRTTFMQ